MFEYCAGDSASKKEKRGKWRSLSVLDANDVTAFNETFIQAIVQNKTEIFDAISRISISCSRNLAKDIRGASICTANSIKLTLDGIVNTT